MYDSLPEYAWQHEVVACPWELKGSAMRWMHERLQAYQPDTTDGVKCFLQPAQWLLVRPDPDRPLLHICVESHTMDTTAALLADHKSQLQSFIEQQANNESPFAV